MSKWSGNASVQFPQDQALHKEYDDAILAHHWFFKQAKTHKSGSYVDRM